MIHFTIYPETEEEIQRFFEKYKNKTILEHNGVQCYVDSIFIGSHCRVELRKIVIATVSENKHNTSFRFVKTYINDKGNPVDIGEVTHNFKKRYAALEWVKSEQLYKPMRYGVPRVSYRLIGLPTFETFDEAQTALNLFAEENKWKEFKYAKL